MKLDLHIHTFGSDGLGTPEQIIDAAKRAGMSGIAICDHNTMRAVEAMRKAAPPDFLIIPGAEYSTTHGHILSLFCEEFGSHLPRDMRARFLLAPLAAFVRQNGGLLVAAHPYRNREFLVEDAPFELSPILLQSVDGIEAVNSRDLNRHPGGVLHLEAAAKSAGLFMTGGSDAHMPSDIGRGYTELDSSVPLTLDGVKNALLSGETANYGQPRSFTNRVLYRILRRIK